MKSAAGEYQLLRHSYIRKEIHIMSRAKFLAVKYAKYDIGRITNYDRALAITCKIEKIFFKLHGELMPNELFNEVFDLIYAG